MSSADQPLYEQLGGADAIPAIVDAMYARVLTDPVLKSYFQNVDLEKLRRMQTEFMGAALGGPETYSGMELSHAHQGRGITNLHFSAFVGHLLAVLEARGCSEQDTQAVARRINTYASDITGNVSTDG
ncbi:group I truncated hemoglobin [Thalassoroseus pseudoceratinae]|uniref:group I truncated hemoglobin n=1 Tax=Thalassoroseus pseudoceratinae TaxID=2713176 RepID=UPI001421846B|nr:group 1 truncated hemoglobin [Thalassoroseus pseudoceratinae]